MKSTTNQRQAMIHFLCPKCNKKYKAAYEKAGRMVGCKSCFTTIVIPANKVNK